jgi:hypothetical protein
MAEKYKLKPGDKLTAPASQEPGLSDEISERLYRDYERLRAELGRLRNDVRRLSEEREPVDLAADDEEPIRNRTANAIAAHPIRFVLALFVLAVAASAGLRTWEYA